MVTAEIEAQSIKALKEDLKALGETVMPKHIRKAVDDTYKTVRRDVRAVMKGTGIDRRFWRIGTNRKKFTFGVSVTAQIIGKKEQPLSNYLLFGTEKRYTRKNAYRGFIPRRYNNKMLDEKSSGWTALLKRNVEEAMQSVQ